MTRGPDTAERVLVAVRRSGREGIHARAITREVRSGRARVDTVLALLEQVGLIARTRTGTWVGLPPGPGEDDALDRVMRALRITLDRQAVAQ